jgi:hypothetical protein
MEGERETDRQTKGRRMECRKRGKEVKKREREREGRGGKNLQRKGPKQTCLDCPWPPPGGHQCSLQM